MKLLRSAAVISLLGLASLGSASPDGAPLVARAPRPGGVYSKLPAEATEDAERYAAARTYDSLAGLNVEERVSRLEAAWDHVHPRAPGAPPVHWGRLSREPVAHDLTHLQAEVALIRKLGLRRSDMHALAQAPGGAAGRVKAAREAWCRHRVDLGLSCLYMGVGAVMGSSAAVAGAATANPALAVAGVGLVGVTAKPAVARLREPHREYHWFMNW